MEQFLITILLAVPALFGIFIILKHPYLGLVIIVSSLPVVGILPDVPFATSVFPIVGGLTIGAHLLSLLRVPKKHRRSGSRKTLILSLLLVLWMFISNPYAALQPDVDGRVWLFTFFQLLILVWLASRLMDKPDKHFILFTAYSLATGVSAFYAVYNGSIADTIKESIRSSGLAGGANGAARYFLVALAFLYYLQLRQRNIFSRIVLYVVMGLIVLGTLVTVSRTGILLLIAAVGMLVILERGRNRPQAFFMVFMSLGVVWFFADNIISIFRTILPSIQSGSDTVGVRYGLWQAGIRMLEAYPLNGVGIGQYPQQLPIYGYDLLHGERYFSLGAHNMYIQVAAEMGLIGLSIFISVLVFSLRIFWNARMASNEDIAIVGKTWLTAFVLLLIGGLTKHDHYDKLLWLMIGVSASSMWIKSVLEKENEKN